MKQKYIKPDIAMIKAEMQTILADTTFKEGGDVSASTGEDEDEDGSWINLAKKHRAWDEQEYNSPWLD